MVVKNNRSDPTGKQQARPNSMRYLRCRSCKHLHVCPAPLNSAGLFLYPKLLAHCCACSGSWILIRTRGLGRSAKTGWICTQTLFLEDIFQVLLFKYQVAKLCSRLFLTPVCNNTLQCKNWGEELTESFKQVALWSVQVRLVSYSSACVCPSVCPLSVTGFFSG